MLCLTAGIARAEEELASLGESYEFDDFGASFLGYRVTQVANKNYIYIYMDYKNQSDAPQMFDSACMVFVYQDDEMCEVPGNDLPGTKFYEITLPGQTGKYAFAYALYNTETSVTVQMMPGSQIRVAPSFRKGIRTYVFDISMAPEDIAHGYTWDEITP